MGKDPNTQMVTQEIVKHVELPILLDADALRVRVMESVQKRKPHFDKIVLTPHMGEFKRIAKLAEANYSVELLHDFSDAYRVLTV